MRMEVTNREPIVKEAKYFHYTLHYKQEGKVFKRKLVSFGASKDAYDILKESQPGEKYDVKISKDENGNWQWTEVAKVEAGSPAAAAKDGTTGKTSNWETSEERARRQILIVRQSCIAQAVAYFNDSQHEPAPADVLKIAGEFEEWVNRE